MESKKFADLPSVHQLAIDEALRVLENAYNPYSGFYVGACLVTESNELITGTNFENAAYGSTICAERAAVLRANAIGIRRFEAIAIIAKGENFNTTEITGPCGSCRQVLYEASQITRNGMQVILSTTLKDKIIVTTIAELLPLAFGPLDLGVDIQKYQ